MSQDGAVGGENMPGKRPKVVFLESQSGTISLFTQGLLQGADAAGWAASVIFLRNAQGQPVSTSDVQSQILAQNPQFIAFLMDAPLSWEDLWHNEKLDQIPKGSFWFDDFYRSPHTLAWPERWAEWQVQKNTTVFIWDRAWREEWQQFTGQAAYPIHLSTSNFSSVIDAFYPALKEWVVMVGTIPSMVSLEKEAAALPVVARKLLHDCFCAMETARWPFQPYQIFHELQSMLPRKEIVLFEKWNEFPENRAIFHHQLWRWGKRIARLRGLRALAHYCPIAVLSGHQTESFAEEAEIRQSLPKKARFQFINTSNISATLWPRLFQSGKFQIQFTDPQSRAGGLPFRIYECAASHAVLLSDSRPELTEQWQDGQELFLALDENQMAQRAGELMQYSHDALRSVGQNAGKKFLQKHTWKQRWADIVTCAGAVKKIEEFSIKARS